MSPKTFVCALLVSILVGGLLAAFQEVDLPADLAGEADGALFPAELRPGRHCAPACADCHRVREIAR